MIVETRDLRVTFGEAEALKGIDLRVPEGSVFAMLGPNGAGKSTTIRVLMNVLRPDAGDATVLGTDSRDLEPQHFQRIGFVSESQRPPGALSLRGYFDYLSRLYERWDAALARHLCAQFDLPADRKLKALSHGMRIKTLLVGALAYRPSLLVLDEPLSGLDTVTRDEIVGGLLQQVQDTTVLISSHELSEIESFTTHVAFLQDGRLAIQESIESMQARFREITATLSDRKTLPAPLPDTWLMPEIQGHRSALRSCELRGRSGRAARARAPLRRRTRELRTDEPARDRRCADPGRPPPARGHGQGDSPDDPDVARGRRGAAQGSGVPLARGAARHRRVRRRRVRDASGAVALWESVRQPLALLGAALLIISVFQLDSAVSVVDDWLCRPVPRRDLLFAKVGLILAVVYGSRVIATLIVDVAQRRSLAETLMDALLLQDEFFLLVLAMLMLIAIVTRTTIQAIGTFIAVFVVSLGLPTAVAPAAGPLQPDIGESR